MVEDNLVVFWLCYDEKCGHVGKKEEFIPSVNGPKCPKCGQDDCTFPYRTYRCKKCGRIDDQSWWFPDLPLDEDPLKAGDEPRPCPSCIEKWESENSHKAGKEISWNRYSAELEHEENTPAEVEEIQIHDLIRET